VQEAEHSTPTRFASVIADATSLQGKEAIVGLSRPQRFDVESGKASLDLKS